MTLHYKTYIQFRNAAIKIDHSTLIGSHNNAVYMWILFLWKGKCILTCACVFSDSYI